MALEVNEIGIRLRVRGEARGEIDEVDGVDEEREEKERGGADACCDLDRDGIVDDCVRRVMQILKSLRER
jgi:hypothetical protein